MTVSLTESQRRLLLAVHRGFRLKDHRDIEGNKRYVLHDPSDNGEEVAAEDVQTLVELGLLSSNKKFPAATYWLTDAGRRVVEQMR